MRAPSVSVRARPLRPVTRCDPTDDRVSNVSSPPTASTRVRPPALERRRLGLRMSGDQRRSERQDHPEDECLLDERERVVREHRDREACDGCGETPPRASLRDFPSFGRHDRAGERSGRSARSIRRGRAGPTSRNRPSHWLSRIGAFRSGLSSPVCLVPTPWPRIGLRMPSTSLGYEIGAPADESRISCKRAVATRSGSRPDGEEETPSRSRSIPARRA